MLQSVLGSLSPDLAIDLGTATVRIAAAGRGVVVDEPACIAVASGEDGERRIVAIGERARRMRGRAPSGLQVVHPVRGGVVEDFPVVEALLSALLEQVHGRRLWVGPRAAVAVPSGTTSMERRALRATVERAGAREVRLVERPVAAARGAGLPVDEARGHMVVDIGAGTTEIAVLSLGRVAYGRTLPVAGDAFDRAVAAALREHLALDVPAEQAEAVRRAAGSALPPPPGRRAPVRGRDRNSGLPRTVEVDAALLHEALAGPVREIAEAVLATMERIPPDLAGDIAGTGVVLVGGGALLRGLDRALGEATGMAVVLPERPLSAVVEGALAAWDVGC